MSSEVSALKAELDLPRTELETERQIHQKEEKTLCARVVEVEKQKDAAKNECKGIVGSFCFLLYSGFPFCCLFIFFFCTLIFFSADLFLLPGLAL